MLLEAIGLSGDGCKKYKKKLMIRFGSESDGKNKYLNGTYQINYLPPPLFSHRIHNIERKFARNVKLIVESYQNHHHVKHIQSWLEMDPNLSVALVDDNSTLQLSNGLTEISVLADVGDTDDHNNNGDLKDGNNEFTNDNVLNNDHDNVNEMKYKTSNESKTTLHKLDTLIQKENPSLKMLQHRQMDGCT